MASNLRVDNIQPTTGTGIGIGTANGSVTFNADVTGGMNITTGSLGVGIDNATATTTGFTRTIRVKGSSTSSGVSGLFAESYAGSAWFGFYSGSSTTDTPALLYPFNGALRIGTTNSVGTGGFAEKFRITNAGNIKFATSGTGIDFSATGDASGMSSEVLDDYEEGSWTPALESAGSPTVSTAVGIYTKIGNFVHCTFYMAFTGATLTSQSRISGLPFAYSSSVEPNIFLSRVGQAHDSSASVGSRNAKSISHTGSGTTWIYVDVITSGTAVHPRGEFVIRAA